MRVLPHDDRGSGEAVVLIHAGVADRSMWTQHLPWLAESGFRAVAVDLPGFGEAEIAPGPQAPWEDVLDTLRSLGLARATFVGNSFGAAVALRVAAVAPAAAFGLVLISPPPLDLDEPSAELAAAWEAENSALERGDIDAAVAAVVGAWLQPGASEALRDRVAAMQRRALAMQMAAPEPEEAPDPLERHPERLTALEMPVLAAAGECDMPDFKRGVRQIAAAAPRGRSAVIKGAGHLAPLEAPEAFRALVEDFLGV